MKKVSKKTKQKRKRAFVEDFKSEVDLADAYRGVKAYAKEGEKYGYKKADELEERREYTSKLKKRKKKK